EVLGVEVLGGPLLGVGELGFVDVVLAGEDELGLLLLRHVLFGHRSDSFTMLMRVSSTWSRVISEVSMMWASPAGRRGEVAREESSSSRRMTSASTVAKSASRPAERSWL